MQIFSRRFLQVGVLIFMTIALALSAQAATFSNASLKGSYSFLTNLWTADVNTDQTAMVGVLTFDGVGTVTGSYTSVTGDVIQTGTLGGTYTVKSNGTGTITFTAGSTAQFAITLNSTAARVAHGVQLLQTNDSNNEIVSGTAVLQSTTAETYSVASLKGTFSALSNRWTADVNLGQVGSIEIFTFDGKGHFNDSQTLVVDGVPTTDIQSGTYTVNPNGTGGVSSICGGFNCERAFALNSVAAGHGKAMQFISYRNTSGNKVDSGTALKQ